MSGTSAGEVVWQEDGTCYTLARITRKDSSHNIVPVQQVNVSSIVRNVYKAATATLVLGPTSILKANAILDTLSQGTVWTADNIGFNFIDEVPPTAFPIGDDVYQVEYKFTLTSGEVYWLVYKGAASPVFTS